MTDRALEGRRVAVLRTGGVDDAVRAALEGRGAAATTIAVATIRDRGDDEVRRGVGALARFTWVAVTSANAARRLALWADAWPAGSRVAVVGPATGAVVERLGLEVGAMAKDATARSIAERIDGGPVLFLAASSARDDLARALGSRGVELVTVVTYDVVTRALDGDDVATVLESDAIVAMSPVAVDALGGLAAEPRAAAARIPLIAIGPTTEQHAKDRHLPVARTAVDRAPGSVADAVGRALEDRVAPPGGLGDRR